MKDVIISYQKATAIIKKENRNLPKDKYTSTILKTGAKIYRLLDGSNRYLLAGYSCNGGDVDYYIN